MFYGSQGSFNYMVFGAADEGSIRLEQRPLQVQAGRTDPAEVARRFAFDGSRPIVAGDPMVLHWVPNAKPHVRERAGDHFAPMTHFRLDFRRTASHGKSALLPDLWHLRLEDLMCSDFRTRGARGRLAGWQRRSRRSYAELKVRIRRRTPDWLGRGIPWRSLASAATPRPEEGARPEQEVRRRDRHGVLRNPGDRERVQHDHFERGERRRRERNDVAGSPNGKSSERDDDPQERRREPARELVEPERQGVRADAIGERALELADPSMERLEPSPIARMDEHEVVLGRRGPDGVDTPVR
jgi:hypothetical protein